jgi:acyl-coenzyme A synthetase/AMP-(fatty) acid ligase
MAFATSGTTGSPVRWLRSQRQLEDEACLIGELIGEIDRVITFVPDEGFLYGHLFGSVFARLRGVPVEQAFADPLAPPRLRGSWRTLLVCNSGTWSLLERLPDLLAALSGVVALHSGGPPTPATARVLAAWEPAGMRAIELLGATETGAVAHRRLSATTPAAAWRLLPDVEMLAPARTGDEGQLEVAGSRIARRAEAVDAPASWTLPDVVRRTGSREFERLGRASRLVKVNGRRCDLDRLERTIADELPELEVACLPVPDAHRGEHYEVLCAPRDACAEATPDLDHVRAVVRAAIEGAAPGPRRVRAVGAIPRTPSGKVRVPVLSALADEEGILR